jgi:hypothetical protein
MPMPSLTSPFKSLRGAFALAGALALCACIFQGKDKVAQGGGGGGWDDFPNANVCGDLTSSQESNADALLDAAKPHLQGEAVFVSSDSAEAWSKLKRRDVDSLDTYYSKALTIAPNHCGALFGKAIVTAYSVIGEPTLDSLVKEAEGSTLDGQPVFGKRSAENAGPALLKVRSGLAGVDKSLLTLAQEVGERILLPKLDSSIAGLEKVVKNSDFRFSVSNREDTWTVDRGEVAPLLATLKIAKALVILIVGYEWRTEIDEDYPYFAILRDLKESDLDSPTPDQKTALDHYTGLLSRGSTFTHIRAGWEARTASIPSLLNEAVGHVQAGLEYGILQQEKGLDQSKDPYRVGTDEKSDIDPADLRDAITRLERIKKYLTGQVLLTWSRDQDSLRVNFPKVFQVNGFQGLLPYFRFYPYSEWNGNPQSSDSMDSGSGTRSKGPIYFTDAANNFTMEGGDLDLYGDDLSALTGKVVFPDPTMGGIFPDLTNDNIWFKARSLGNIKSRVDCPEPSPDYAPSLECKLPVKPSDLDILIYFLGMGIL